MARPRLVTDEQILGTTRRLVLEEGPGVSLQEIARQLGVTEPALIKRFGNRTQLFLAALRPPEEPPWLAAVAPLPDARPLEAQLEHVLGALHAFFEEALPCWTALRESGIPHDQVMRGDPPGPVRSIEALTRWLRCCHARGLVARVEFESLALAMLGAVQARVLLTHLLRASPIRSSASDYIRHLAALYAAALRPRAPITRNRPRGR